MEGPTLDEELRLQKVREDDAQSGDSAEAQTSPVLEARAGRDSIACLEVCRPTRACIPALTPRPKNDADVEFNIHDEGSLQAYLSNLVGEVISETPTQRDIHNLTLRFSSPGSAAPAHVLERLASFMKLAGETLQAELEAVRAGQGVRPAGPGVEAPPTAATPLARNTPKPTDLLTVFSTVPRT